MVGLGPRDGGAVTAGNPQGAGLTINGPTGTGGGGGGGLAFRVIASGANLLVPGANYFWSAPNLGPFTLLPGEVAFLALSAAEPINPIQTAGQGLAFSGLPVLFSALNTALPTLGARILYPDPATSPNPLDVHVTFFNDGQQLRVNWALIGLVPGASPPPPVSRVFTIAKPPILVNGQTAFTLSPTPFAGTTGTMLLWVNGVLYEQGTSYTIAGSALTWLDAPFTLTTTDEIVAFYQA